LPDHVQPLTNNADGNKLPDVGDVKIYFKVNETFLLSPAANYFE